jgi:hypothetical protein
MFTFIDVVLSHISTILHACLEECESENITLDILERLLKPLLPLAKADNPITYSLISNILKQNLSCLHIPLSKFFNNILIGTKFDEDDERSELAEHVYALIYELHKLKPDLLLHFLPSICIQLEVEDEEIRYKATKLLGFPIDVWSLLPRLSRRI